MLDLSEQIRDVDGHHAPDAFMDDFTIVVRKYVTLRGDVAPRDVRMSELERGRDMTRGLANDFNPPFDGCLELIVRKIFVIRDAANVFHGEASMDEHVSNACFIIMRRHG